MQDNAKRRETQESPDWYGPVAEDVLGYCRPQEGVWIDLGSGSGGVGLALARMSSSTILLIDPQAESLIEALNKARGSCVENQVMTVVAHAESMPLPNCSVDLVASRGSIFFWRAPPQGLREVQRILRPGGKAMIGGGLGSAYPQWARQEFFRQQQQNLTTQGPEAIASWHEVRKPETFRRWATEAGLGSFRIIAEPSGPGRWILFAKEITSE